MHDQNLRKNHLHNFSVLFPMIKHQGVIQDQMTIHIDTVVEVHLVRTVRKKTFLTQYRQRSTSRTRYNHNRHTTPHTTLDHVMIIIKDILAHTVHHTGLLIDHPTTVIHVPDTNLDLTPEKITSKNTLLHTDLLQELGIHKLVLRFIYTRIFSPKPT